MSRSRSPRRKGSDPQRSRPAGRRQWGVGIAIVAAAIAVSVLVLGTVSTLGAGEAPPTSQDTFAPLVPLDGEDGAPGSSVDSGLTTTIPDGVAPPPTSTTLVVSPTTTTTTTAASPPPNQVFAPTSPFNAAIPANPILDPESDRMVEVLRERVVANLYQFGIGVEEVDESTAAVVVDCTKPWGTCLLDGERQRIPSDARPAPGSDGTLVVIDWSERRTVELWQAVQRPDGSWSTSWGTTTPIDGTGIPTVFGNGAGVSHLAGVVRVDEIADGNIDHALAFSSSYTCGDDYRYPATKTDGESPRRDCIPEGARIQLDPSIDLDEFDFTSAEYAIARAFQTYGAYAIDTGGTAMALNFEIADDAISLRDPGTAYVAAGLTADYFLLDAIPWQHLRVLNAWDGT